VFRGSNNELQLECADPDGYGIVRGRAGCRLQFAFH
jgi:hypothetical protein